MKIEDVRKKIAELKLKTSTADKIKMIEELKDADDAEIIPELVKFFGDFDIQVKNTALKTIEYIVSTKFLEAYAKSDSQHKDNMLKMLSKLDEEFTHTIKGYLASDDPPKRVIAIEMLEKIGNYDQIALFLNQAMKDKSEKVRATVARAISSSGDIDILRNMLQDPDARVRANALESLDKIGPKDLTRLFMQYRMDPNNRIRAVALKALWNRGYTEIEGLITNMVEDRNEDMRASAAWLIGEIGNKDMMKILAKLAKDHHPHVRINVISALMKMGGPDIKNRLAELLKK